MKKNFLVRAFFGITIVALGGVLLLRNLEIIKFDSWNVFWGTVWAAVLVLAGSKLPEAAGAGPGAAPDGCWCVNWSECVWHH